MMIKDDDLFAENATFNAPTCPQTHFTHTFIKYVCICSTTIHRVPRERRREICFVEETIEENSTMQFTRRGREEIGRGFKQK
jgi:predicted ATP-dependent protease